MQGYMIQAIIRNHRLFYSLFCALALSSFRFIRYSLFLSSITQVHVTEFRGCRLLEGRWCLFGVCFWFIPKPFVSSFTLPFSFLSFNVVLAVFAFFPLGTIAIISRPVIAFTQRQGQEEVEEDDDGLTVASLPLSTLPLESPRPFFFALREEVLEAVLQLEEASWIQLLLKASYWIQYWVCFSRLLVTIVFDFA